MTVNTRFVRKTWDSPIVPVMSNYLPEFYTESNYLPSTESVKCDKEIPSKCSNENYLQMYSLELCS